MAREARGDGITRWLLPASVLHGAVVLAAALSPWARPTPERATSRHSSAEAELSLELTLLDDGAGSLAPGAMPSAAIPFAAAAASDEPRAPRVGTESSQPPVAARLELASSATPSRSASEEPANEPPRPASPRLSLDQLGIGTNPFLDITVEPLTKAEQASTRLQAALQPPSLDRDRQRSLGPAGPVADAARRLVLADDSLVETSAVLNVRVDGAGHVTEVHVLESSSPIKAWQLIAARLAHALNPVTLRGGSSKRGWDVKLRLASSVRLPSGAAPGMRMGVLGQQVAGSGGPGSTSLELSPTSKLDLDEPIDNVGRHLDQPIQFEAMLLKLRADPADFGAQARRVVEVAVLSIDELAAP
jgi:hypothetical protein